MNIKIEDIQKLPKVELHSHLDCSMSFDLVSKINPQISKNEYDSEFVGPLKCNSLSEILKYVTNQVNLMQTEENIRLVVKDLFNQLREENVIYTEIRFAPLLHLSQGLKPEAVVEIVADEISICSNETAIEAGIILCTLRHFNEKESMQTVELVKRYITNSLVIGFDIAADEEGYSIDANKKAFLYAIENDLPRTAHAGEAKGPESMWETINNFKPSRIGHGVRSVEDPSLVDYLIENNIHLEVCPTCNIQTNIFDEYKDHPVNFLFNSGVSVGINTDGRTLCNVSLNEEYQKLVKTFNWGIEPLKQCNLNSVSHAFLSDLDKKYLTDKIKTGFKKS
ncbi:MAG: adenosine deaminase [Ignavibacteria bacterium]|jgi:adenosine deaminase